MSDDIEQTRRNEQLPIIVEHDTHIREVRKEVDEYTEIVEHTCPECGYDRATRKREDDLVISIECQACDWSDPDAFTSVDDM